MILNLQKASLWKRISAFLFDIILTATLIIGLAAVVSAFFNYDGYTTQLTDRYAAYEQEYGVDFDISDEDYAKLTEEEKSNYVAANEALYKDAELLRIYNLLFYMTLAIISISCFIGILVWNFLIPLLFGNGQTLGKKIFGTCVVRTNGVKATNPVLFIRAMVGSFAIETMFPLFLFVMLCFGMIGFIGTITLLLFFVLQIGVMIYTNTNSAIHDLLCDTVVVDVASQMIFDTEEERIAYIQELQKQNVLNSSN